MLKCWANIPGYETFVREQWSLFDVNGWGGFVLQQNLKMIKGSLKEWHQQHAQNLSGKVQTTKDRMLVLDTKGETSNLEEAEAEELHDLSESLHSLSRVQASMSWQKARLNWLQEGDANTKFFHGVMSSRRRCNAI